MAQRSSVDEKKAGRQKRPQLPRSEPLRNWSTLFGGPGPNGSRTATAPSATDSVRGGVELGYRVIDEYVRQGAAVAGGFANAEGPKGLPGQDLGQMTERMLKYASDFASLWFDVMGMMVSTRNGTAANEQVGVNGASSAARTTSETRSVAIHVRATQPVDVLLTVDTTLSAGASLSVENLRARTGSISLDDVAIESPTETAGPLRVSLDVPKGTPKGRYTGVILDAASSNPTGRLTVTIHE